MAKGRMLQNRISKSHKLASLSSDTVRLLYTWMLSHLDVNGSFYADPIMVNNLVFTRLGHSVKTISSALDELDAAGLIVRFQVDGEVYLNYPDFQDKQPKLYPEREGEPDIPKVTHELIMINATTTQSQYKIKESKIKESKSSNAGFDEFYKIYPKKVNKKEAIAAWNKSTTLPPLETIIKAVEKQKKSDQWLKDNGQYIPNPSTWINKERWTDELSYGGNNNGNSGNGKGTPWIQPREHKPEPRPEVSDSGGTQIKNLLGSFYNKNPDHPDQT
jgi:hypothetical protein